MNRPHAAALFGVCLFLPCFLYAQAVDEWLTNADRTKVLAPARLAFDNGGTQTAGMTIVIDATKSYQQIDGFGFAMTGGSAQLLHRMSPAARHALLQGIFGRGPEDYRVSYLRVSVGASDMNHHVYTYDDMPAGESDPELQHFSLREDEADVVPVLKEVLGINPAIHIMASPWTAPSWMKTNDAAKAGALRPEWYGAYAAYLVRYLKAMQAHGVPIAAMTIQNEPLNTNNTPSMVMQADEEKAFLQDALGPALLAAGLKTHVVLFDHNCDRPDYAMSILADAKAARFADGSGFHLYAGEISAMSQVHDAFPAKNLYFTEQMVVEHTRDGVQEPVSQPVARIVIGAMRNWSRTVLLWNFAADASFGPHTGNGGCPVCQGSVTLAGDQVTRNIALYTIAHASRFVPPGSVRIESSAGDAELANVAWRTPAGKYVLLLTNNGAATRSVRVIANGKGFTALLDAGSVATFVW